MQPGRRLVILDCERNCSRNDVHQIANNLQRATNDPKRMLTFRFSRFVTQLHRVIRFDIRYF